MRRVTIVDITAATLVVVSDDPAAASAMTNAAASNPALITALSVRRGSRPGSATGTTVAFEPGVGMEPPPLKKLANLGGNHEAMYAICCADPTE